MLYIHKKYIKYFIILVLNIQLFSQNFDYVFSTKVIYDNSDSQPQKGKGITDPDFHTTFYRITDVVTDNVGDNMASLVYSRFSPINSDGTKLLLQRTVGWRDALIYDASNPWELQWIAPQTTTVDGVAGVNFVTIESRELRWDLSGNHPNRFYYLDGMKFLYYDYGADTAHTVRDFSSDFPTGNRIMNDVEGTSSDDSRYWAWQVRKAYDGSKYPMLCVFTYDMQQDSILGVLDSAAYVSYGGNYAGTDGNSIPTPNMVEISPDGSKMIYHLGRCWGDESYGNRPNDIGGYFDGGHAWDLDIKNPVKISIGEEHSGWVVDTTGVWWFISQNSRTDYIEARRIDTGESINIYYHGDLGWGNGWHFARMPSVTPQWCLISTYREPGTSSGKWGDNQIFMLELKELTATDTARIWRLGHTHNYHDEYYAEGDAAISLDGQTIWWNAKWPGQDNIETYEIKLPYKWWLDIDGKLGKILPPKNLKIKK